MITIHDNNDNDDDSNKPIVSQACVQWRWCSTSSRLLSISPLVESNHSWMSGKDSFDLLAWLPGTNYACHTTAWRGQRH